MYRKLLSGFDKYVKPTYVSSVSCLKIVFFTSGLSTALCVRRVFGGRFTASTLNLKPEFVVVVFFTSGLSTALCVRRVFEAVALPLKP